MKAIIQLTNGHTANTDDIKCPICGRNMEIDNYKTELKEDKFVKKPMSWPFFGSLTTRETTYETVFRCLNGCGDFTVEHTVKTLLT